MAVPQVLYVESDMLPDLSFEFEGINLSIYTSITLRVRREDGTLLTRLATIDDAAGGLGHFAFAAGEITPGNHEAEIRTIRASDSKAETYPDDQPIQFIVREQV